MTTIMLSVLLLFLATAGPAWAAAAVVTRTTGESRTTAGTDHTVTLSGTAVAGERLVACIVGDGVITAFSWGTWSELSDVDQGSAVLACAHKLAVGGETTETVTSTGSDTSKFVAWRLSGAHATTAPQAGTTATGSSLNPDPPSVTAAWGAEPSNLWLAIAGLANNHSINAFPAGYTNTQSQGIATATNIGSAELTNAAATENPGTFTQSSTGSWLAQTLVVRSAGGRTAYRALLGVGY